MRFTMLVGLLCGGCYPPPDCAEGYLRNKAGDCQADTQDDSGTGSSDTARPYWAELSGPIQIGVYAQTDALVIEDVCEGSVALTQEAEALSGTLSCVFSGTLASIIGSEPFIGILSGTVAEDQSIAGPLQMELGAFGTLDASWEGNRTGQGVDGTFGEEADFVIGALEIPVTYTGSFSAVE